MRLRIAWVVLVACAAASCASTPKAAPKRERPARVAKQKPAAPKPAPFSPAEDPVAIKRQDPPLLITPPQHLPPPELGMASYYADSLAGNRTANGERYRPEDKTCAHRKHRFGTKLVVTDVDTGKSATCRVNDRGPYVQGRVIDVSRSVADQLGMRKRGVIRVKVELAAEGTGS